MQPHNDMLQAARERMPSPSIPGEPLSRPELAKLVNEVLFGSNPDLASISGFTGNYVGKLERGEICWPGPKYRAALRTVLGVATDAELGFHKLTGACAPETPATAHTVPDHALDRPKAGTETDCRVPVSQADLVSAPSSDLAPIAGHPMPDAQPAGQAVPFYMQQHRMDRLRSQLLGRAEGTGPMRRRTFINDANLVGLGLVTSALALESTRLGLDLACTEERAQVTIDEWNEIVWEHGYRYMVTPPGELLDALNIDMTSMQIAFTADHDTQTVRELRRAAAMLAVFSAMTLANLGDVRQARRWWRTAKRLADQSNDPSTIVWVRGREIVRAQYEQFPLNAVLDLVRQAEPAAATAPDTATTEFITGKAQAFAMAGMATEARAALQQAHEVYERLPTEVTTNTGSLLGWPADRLLFTTSYVHSHLGDYPKADLAQEAAIRAYPSGHRRGPAQIQLQRALCLTKAGDIEAGLHHAQDVMTTLPADDHIRPVVDLAHRVYAAVPASDQHRPAAAEYRQLLHSLNVPRGATHP